jgi:allene oxide cyclase-like protein
VQSESSRGRPIACVRGCRSVIEVVALATSINDFVDIGPTGPSPGDVYVFTDTLVKPHDENQALGRAEGRCNLINPDEGRFECTIVSSLPDGTITTDGMLVNVPGTASVGAITGGTGAYRNSRGEATLLLGTNRHEVRFVLTGLRIHARLVRA